MDSLATPIYLNKLELIGVEYLGAYNATLELYEKCMVVYK